MAMAKLDLDQFSRESQSSESLHFENMDDEIEGVGVNVAEDDVGEDDREEHDIDGKDNVSNVVGQPS